MMTFLQSTVAAIVWTLAVVVYLGMVRKGVRGFGRFAAFWAGFPATWAVLAVTKEQEAARIEARENDEIQLLREIRNDRLAREPQLRIRPRKPDGEVGAKD